MCFHYLGHRLVVDAKIGDATTPQPNRRLLE